MLRLNFISLGGVSLGVDGREVGQEMRTEGRVTDMALNSVSILTHRMPRFHSPVLHVP